jgi:hypothetical protein
MKMKVLQDLLTDSNPLETYSLLGLLTNIWKQYKAEPQGRLGMPYLLAVLQYLHNLLYLPYCFIP